MVGCSNSLGLPRYAPFRPSRFQPGGLVPSPISVAPSGARLSMAESGLAEILDRNWFQPVTPSRPRVWTFRADLIAAAPPDVRLLVILYAACILHQPDVDILLTEAEALVHEGSLDLPGLNITID